MFNINDERLIDFSSCKLRNGGYTGANGRKLQVEYDNNIYMLKFPGIAKINANIHYANSCVTEYLGCHIYQEIGIPVQKTILGKYYINGEYKPVVACCDFTYDDRINEPLEILDFVATKNSVIDSPGSGKGTELSNILDAISLQDRLDPEVLLNRFWEMFVVDAFIGNWDRHNGNWGLLYAKKADLIVGLAPVYDCGSTLFPQADEIIMQKVLDDINELKLRVYERPQSAIMVNGVKINYYDFMISSDNNDLKATVMKLIPRINLDRINGIIDNTPGIDSISKSFYRCVLKARKELILDKVYNHYLPLDINTKENINSKIKHHRS